MGKKEKEFKQNNWLYLSIVAIVAIAAIVVMSTGVSKLSLTSGQTAITSEDDLAGQASGKAVYKNKCFYNEIDGCTYDSSDSLQKEFKGCSDLINGKCKDICKTDSKEYYCEEKQMIESTSKSSKVKILKTIAETKKTPTEFCKFEPPDGCTYDKKNPSLPKDFKGCSDLTGKCKDICETNSKEYYCYKK